MEKQNLNETEKVKPSEKNYRNSLYNYYDQEIKDLEYDKYYEMMEKGEELPEGIKAIEEEPIIYDEKEEFVDPTSSLIIEKENLVVNKKELNRLRKMYPNLEYRRTFSEDEEFRIKTKIKVIRQFKFVKRIFITDEEYDDLVMQEKYSEGNDKIKPTKLFTLIWIVLGSIVTIAVLFALVFKLTK